jgi:hypothetical protein
MIDSVDSTLMLLSGFVLLGTFWYMVQSLTWLVQAVGYMFGLLLASWTFDRYLPPSNE